jgi:hypothetical protein
MMPCSVVAPGRLPATLDSVASGLLMPSSTCLRVQSRRRTRQRSVEAQAQQGYSCLVKQRSTQTLYKEGEESSSSLTLQRRHAVALQRCTPRARLMSCCMRMESFSTSSHAVTTPAQAVRT